MAPSEFTSSGRQRRSLSMSSDRTSLTGYGGLVSPPWSISPDPAFIAASAASQIVTNDHDSQADAWFDQHGIEPSGETALVAVPTLRLVNRFLDQLLFNFLAVSKSTELTALREAVRDVLRPKLATDAINGAEQELHEYMGPGEDDEEPFVPQQNRKAKSDWDVELVWKRTRLRCMVYSSLGDMEEEDEDYYTEQEQLDGSPGSARRFFDTQGVVSPAVAIFLTSILEFMGEQVLIVAGQAAYQRLRSKHEKQEREGTSTQADIADRVVVEEFDMERVALDRTLGRLWRGWKKRIRTPTTSISAVKRSFSRDSLLSQTQLNRGESLAQEDPINEDERTPSVAAVLAEHEYAASIPLPLTADDVREIEIPGLASQSDDDEEDVSSPDEGVYIAPRPNSMMIVSKQLDTSIFLSPSSRKRSDSLPTPARSPYKSPSSKRQTVDLDLENDNSTIKTNDLTIRTTEPKAKNSKPPLANIITRPAPIGVAAVHGQAPQTAADSVENARAGVDFSEEPQIMTSSRISIGGGISPDDQKGISRRSSVRSLSMHSLRLIDVSSPRSPGPSRTGSADPADLGNGRAVVVSRPANISSPMLMETHSPRVASPVLRVGNANPVVRNTPSLSTRQTGNSAGDPISEAEEQDGNNSDHHSPVKAILAEPRHVEPQPSIAATQSAPGIPRKHSPALHQVVASDVPGNHSPSTRPGPFILSPPPPARNIRDTPHVPNANGSQQNGDLNISLRTTNLEHGMTQLTSLREMKEATLELPNEASSATHNNDAHSGSDYSTHSNMQSTHSSIALPIQRPLESPTSSRAPVNVARSSPRPSKESGRKGVPEPLAKSQRSLHTSGSGSSSASYKLKPVLTSEDNLNEPKGQSFEQLIRSDQTIQYTLTPQNMRNIESSPDSPRQAPPPPALVPNGHHESSRPAASRSYTTSVSKNSALHSNPATEKAKSVKTFHESNSGARLRPNAPQARDARVDRDSIGDFADFIRSTGPASSYELILPRTAPSHQGASGSSRNASSLAPRVSLTGSLPKRAESSAGSRNTLSRLEAREPVIPKGDSISDLIDFVRAGPQSDNHRIPRTVAPFRTTMDSDQMTGIFAGRAIDASLHDSQVTQVTNTSHSSVTSQSALLSGLKTKQYPVQSPKEPDQEDMMPKRKTRRVVDPYSIEYSDDEDIEGSSRPEPIKEEESLADFLRNVPPPPEPTTTSVFESVSRPTSGNKSLKKKNSSSIMARFTRHSSTSNLTPHVPPKSSPQVHQPHTQTSRATSSHTPLTVNYSAVSRPAPLSEQSENSRLYASLPDAPRPRVVQRNYEPREAQYSSRRTNDLADFFMTSPPPTMMQTEPQTFIPALQHEEASAFRRMFGRRRG